MTSIPQNLRYLPHTLETRYHAVKTYRNGASVAFICRRYKPKILQTDNGFEFTHFKETKQVHPLDLLCQELGIEHKLIRPRTPRHNGKVERSHRNDNQRFYQHLTFYSYDDLIKQMKTYLYRSNRLPMQTLGWKSPIDIRKALLGASS